MEAAEAGVVGAEDAARFKRAFTDFLDSSAGRKDYGARVRELVEGMQDAEDAPRRLFVDLGDLRGFDARLARELMDAPSDCIEPFEDALSDVCMSMTAASAGSSRSRDARSRTSGAASSRWREARAASSASLFGKYW